MTDVLECSFCSKNKSLMMAKRLDSDTYLDLLDQIHVTTFIHKKDKSNTRNKVYII